MKLLFIIGPMMGGGGEKQLIDLCSGLDKSEFTTHVAVLNYKGRLYEELEKVADHVTLIPKSNKFDVRVIFRLRSLIQDIKPDLIQTYMWTGNLWGRLAALTGFKGPLITTEHCNGQSKTAQHIFIDRILYHFTHRLISVSHAGADFYQRVIGVPKSKIQVIHNGRASLLDAPIRTSALEVLQLPANRPIVSLIGRFSKEKGHKRLLKIIPDIIQQVPNVLFYLPGEGDMWDEINAQCKKMHLEKHVILPGFVENMSAVYAVTDVVIIPSDFEGISLVLLEAIAWGLPIVATSVGGTPEVITSGKDGFLFSPNALSKFTSPLVALLRSSKLRQKIGQAAKLRFNNHFTQQKMVAKFVEVYREFQS
jgi:glycosyltransferase involved in cell wall biosynthesis